MERVMRFELTTATLATWGSTTELHPHVLFRDPACLTNLRATARKIMNVMIAS